MQNSAPSVRLQQIAPSYDFRPFGDLLRPLIQAALIELKKDRFRKGTILIPIFLVWVVFVLTIRRDLNTQAVIEWMISAARLSEGALSFRALDIEQIGHVYEGLLDHTAKRAATPVLGIVGQRAMSRRSRSPNWSACGQRAKAT